MNVDQLFDQLKIKGLLLQADAQFPSLTGLITGEALKGSWWGHPRGKEIFNLSNDLAEHPDVLVTKLVGGKVTFVHRALWPAVLGVGQARDSWQLAGLSPIARALFDRVQKQGELCPENLVEDRSARAASFGPYITELEKKLLVQSEQIHTESGSHSKIIYSWENWAKAHGFREKVLPLDIARARLEDFVGELNQLSGAKVKLPWVKR